MIEEKVDQEGLILQVKTDRIDSLKNMLNRLEHIQNNTDLPKHFRILEDVTNTKVVFNKGDIDILIKKMHELAQEFDMIKHAVIVDSPKNTAYAMIIRQEKINDNYKFQIFCTKKGALQWLNNKISIG